MDKYAKQSLDGLKSMIAYEEEIFTKYEFGEYSRVYPFTNEHVRNQLGLVNLDINSKALTVLSSGDHAFNLVCNGILNVDTFDLNRLTDFYSLGLKRALITIFSYTEFLEFIDAIKYQKGYMYISAEEFQKKKDFIEQSILDSTYVMDNPYRDFWRGVLDYFSHLEKTEEYGSRIEIFERLTRGRTDDLNFVNENNNYLTTEYMYNILKRNLGKANISYIPTDVFNIHKVLGNRRYDFISLSNVLDYATEEFGMLWGYSELEPFISNVETICNDGGIILLHSVLLRRGHDVYEENIPVFRDSTIYKSFLKDLEYHVIPSTRKKEGVVLKKVSRMG